MVIYNVVYGYWMVIYNVVVPSIEYINEYVMYIHVLVCRKGLIMRNVYLYIVLAKHI